jgi:hypothetical protein
MIMVVLIEYLWDQKNRYEGVKEYCELVESVCTNRGGVNLLGLFKPLNESWNWAQFFEADDMDCWQNVIDEVEKRYHDNRENIIRDKFRFYSQRNYNPKHKNLGPMRFLNIELDVWEGINIGIKEYFDAHVKIFEEIDGVWIMGQYSIWNEHFNWAHLYWYDTHQHWDHACDVCWRSMGRPERVKELVGRTYEVITLI